MTAFWNHLRALWPGWTMVAPVPFVAHAFWALSAHDFHWENAVALALALALFATGPRTKKLFLGVYPLALVGVLYSTMKLVQNVGLSSRTVHLCDVRSVEVMLFGVDVNGTRGTLHDWFQAHATPAVDVACAVPYATFMFVCIGFAIWLYFRDYGRMLRFAWCFLALNVAGFLTYHLFPAAPPWYYHSHGCVVDMSAAASEGPNLARVDALLGVPYFHAMYGRASDVFGAMPSLHCAYACIVMLEGWAVFRLPTRLASVAFYLAMCFSAVYLDHHWVLDAIAGSAYCCAIVTVASRIQVRARVHGQTPALVAVESGQLPPSS
ncbi:MAG TPA: phosphatase PAP2 family protein [Polyangiaceae bacterium]|nr:phosphatase PAP2 family protein [Polyangiaceae bacterium]